MLFCTVKKHLAGCTRSLGANSPETSLQGQPWSMGKLHMHP